MIFFHLNEPGTLSVAPIRTGVIWRMNLSTGSLENATTTSRDCSPGDVEASPVYRAVGLESEGQLIPSAGDLHGVLSRSPHTKLGYPRRVEVRASIDLQDVEVASCVIFHIEVVDGELNATPGGGVNVPDTLLVGGVPHRVARATEGASIARQLSTTTVDEPLHLKPSLSLANPVGVEQHLKPGACGAPRWWNDCSTEAPHPLWAIVEL